MFTISVYIQYVASGKCKGLLYIHIYIYNVYFMSTPLPSPVLSHLDDWLTINSDNVITIHSSDVLQESRSSCLAPDLAPELLNGH